MADMVISATIAGPITATITTLAATITKTSTVTRIVGDSIAVFTGASAAIIVIFTVIGDIGIGTFSTAIIGPMAEAIIVTSLQGDFTPTHQGGTGLATAKSSQNEKAGYFPR